MSEKCQICGGEIKQGMGEKWCERIGCAVGWATDAATFDRIQAALALLKRVESGQSVEIRKRDGEWPLIMLWTPWDSQDYWTVEPRFGEQSGRHYGKLENAIKDWNEAAAKRNGGAK